jgi:autotransporter-associated beta strand protein
MGGNGAVAPTVSAVTLEPNTSGGLTKLGAGTLTLSATNRYAGPTTVSGGTLKLGSAGALPATSAVVLSGGTLDLGGFTCTNGLTALGGALTNGTLQTVLSPAGEGVVGSQAVTLSGAVLTGTYLADVAADGGSDLVAVTGSIDLSGLTLQLVEPGLLDRHKQYTLLTCAGTLTGNLAAANLPDSRWHVAYLADGTVRLVFVEGTLIQMR